MGRLAVLYAFAAATLFGLATPLAKWLLGSVEPLLLGGLFYLGSGIGMGAWWSANRLRRSAPAEAPLERRDMPWLAGAVLAGGVIAPALMMAGLSQTPSADASLLLTLEGPATALLAWFLFRENFDRRIMAGMALLAAGAITLAWQGTPNVGHLVGPFLIMAACVAWGIDNNITRRISLGDPVQIAAIKGAVAGPVIVALAAANGASAPPLPLVVTGLVVGFLGYGLSLALFVVALRHLGAARTSAYFATGPFIGAVASLVLPDQSLTPNLMLGGALMAAGVWLHLSERHDHFHRHETTEHDHRHVHDVHHQHDHADTDPRTVPHRHRHLHAPVAHAHRHLPDSHHRHVH